MSLDNVDSDSEINLIPSVRFTRSVNRKFASAESVHPDTLLNKGLLFERKRSRLPKKISLKGSEALLIENAEDRKSTRLNSSHVRISYAVFCLKKKKKNMTRRSHSTRPTTASYRTHHHPTRHS